MVRVRRVIGVCAPASSEYAARSIACLFARQKEEPMDTQSRRAFLAMVERRYPDELVRISESVRRELDITATVFELERAGRSPVVIFENVDGFDMPVVTNLAGNRRLIAAAMGVEPSALATTFRARCQNYQPVERVERAPWQEVVVEDDAVDLTKLPIPSILRSMPRPISPPVRSAPAIPRPVSTPPGFTA